MSLVDTVKKDLASVHAQQQAARFGRLLVITMGAQLAALGTGHLDRDALIAAAVGALEAAYRQWVPVVPWRAVAARLHLLDTPTPPDTAAAPPLPPVVQ